MGFEIVGEAAAEMTAAAEGAGAAEAGAGAAAAGGGASLAEAAEILEAPAGGFSVGALAEGLARYGVAELTSRVLAPPCGKARNVDR